MGDLRFPAPYAGGKSSVADQVWHTIGRVDHYREPFLGSGAIFLAAPQPATTEVLNDSAGLLTNVWRSLQLDPESTAAAADDWINEIDLFARHVALVQAIPSLTDRLMSDPDYCDPRLAGWWLWGASQWIGSDFATGRGAWTVERGSVVRARDRGVARKMPILQGNGSRSGWGTQGVARQIPAFGASSANPNGGLKGVHRIENESGATGVGRAIDLRPWFAALSARLRGVRVVCGNWDRILTDSICWNYKGIKGVILDPPYPGTDNSFYHSEDSDPWGAAQRWALDHGDRPDARIVLFGLDDQSMPETWRRVTWSRNGGYGNQANGAGRANAARECIWYSPHCGQLSDLPMFSETRVTHE